jgi:predicted nucleic acid-binding protein
MKNKLVVDSSVLIPIFNNEEIHFRDSKRFFDHALKERQSLLIPLIVLFEVFHVLKKLNFFDIQNSHEMFMEFFNYECFEYIDLNMPFFNLFKQVDFFDRLKTSDAIVCSCALATSSILISWDKKLVSSSHSGYTPSDYLKNF